MFVVIIVLVLCFNISFAQSSTYSISAKIDSLQELIINYPNNFNYRAELIDKYLESGNPELALLEIIQTEEKFSQVLEVYKRKGIALFQLNQTVMASKSIIPFYLAEPSDEILLCLTVLKLAEGLEEEGKVLLESIKKKNIDAVSKYKSMLNLFNQSSLEVPTAIKNAILYLDVEEYQNYFSKPNLEIVSPKELTFITDSIRLVFNISHFKPIKIVKIENTTIFERATDRIDDLSVGFNRNFEEKLLIKPGKNPFNIIVTDVHGNKNELNVEVYNINFNGQTIIKNPLSDSLSKIVKLITSYIPEEFVAKSKEQNNKNLILVTNNEYFETETEFIFNLLNNRISSTAFKENSKILNSSEINQQILDVLTNEWLTKASNDGTINLILSGRGVFERGRIYFQYNDLEKIDISETITKILNANPKRFNIIWLNGGNNISATYNFITEIISSSQSETSILAANGFRIDEQLFNLLSYQLTSTEPVNEIIEIEDVIAGKEESVLFYKNHENKTYFTISPVGSASSTHLIYFSQLDAKLLDDKVNNKNKLIIKNFTKDWRYFNETYRYINGQMTVADLLARIEEYKSRIGGEIK